MLNHAGASFSPRCVDTRVTKEVRDGTATYSGSKTGYQGILDSQVDAGSWPTLINIEPPVDTDADGMPDAWEIEMKLDPAVANANGKSLSTAYDNIEVYINSLVGMIVAISR